MKRNMELVRQILLKLSDHKHGYAPNPFTIDDYTDEEIGYHCLLLSEAKLIKAVESSAMDDASPRALPIRLTWEGHEFIENVRNENVWNQTKEIVGKLGDASFSVWTSVLSQVIIKNLGI